MTELEDNVKKLLKAFKILPRPVNAPVPDEEDAQPDNTFADINTRITNLENNTGTNPPWYNNLISAIIGNSTLLSNIANAILNSTLVSNIVSSILNSALVQNIVTAVVNSNLVDNISATFLDYIVSPVTSYFTTNDYFTTVILQIVKTTINSLQQILRGDI